MIPAPESFREEARSQQRSMSNLGQLVILDYLRNNTKSKAISAKQASAG
jgi:hypothetical protein